MPRLVQIQTSPERSVCKACTVSSARLDEQCWIVPDPACFESYRIDSDDAVTVGAEPDRAGPNFGDGVNAFSLQCGLRLRRSPRSGVPCAASDRRRYAPWRTVPTHTRPRAVLKEAPGHRHFALRQPERHGRRSDSFPARDGPDPAAVPTHSAPSLSRKRARTRLSGKLPGSLPSCRRCSICPVSPCR